MVWEPFTANPRLRQTSPSKKMLLEQSGQGIQYAQERQYSTPTPLDLLLGPWLCQ